MSPDVRKKANRVQSVHSNIGWLLCRIAALQSRARQATVL